MSIEDLELWFSEAINDFDGGDLMMRGGKFNLAVFDFVQAAEKAVMAILYYFDVTGWGHDIEMLPRQYEEFGRPVAEILKESAKELQRHYISTRYPDASPGIAPKDAYDEVLAQDLREKAGSILTFAQQEKNYLLQG